MNLENVKVGDRFRNYKELCRILEIPEKTSDSKACQLKDLQQFVGYEKMGQAFIIREVYNSPIIKIDKRNKSTNKFYLNGLELVVLDYLTKNKEKHGYNLIELTTLDIAILTGLCSNEFRDKTYAEIKNKYPNITKKNDDLFRRRVRSKLTKIIDAMVNDLQSRFILHITKGHKIKEMDSKGVYSWRTANDKEETMIVDASQKTMKLMGFEEYEKFNKVVASFRVKEFYMTLNNVIKEDYDWESIYKVYFLGFTESIENSTEQFKKKYFEIADEKDKTNFMFLTDIDKQADRIYHDSLQEYEKNKDGYFGEIPFQEMMKISSKLLPLDYIETQLTLSQELVKLK
jgi:hypothetical protein